MTPTTIAELLKHAREGMHKAIEGTRKEFAGIRSGKATTSLLDLVRVEAYGSHMPLNQLAMVAAPEPRLLTVQPFDKSLAPVIEKAIRDADLGLNPASAGGVIRVPLPALTEERRKELVRLVHKLGEEGRVSIRHHRTECLKHLKKVEHVSEDEVRHGEKELQKLTDDHIQQIDKVIAAKEAEIMEV
jgi:ribosome recycling factor